MNLAIVYSRAAFGMRAPLVTVEVHISGGLPSFHIVGLPETVVKESRDRVRSALLNTQFDFPRRRITVNLAPADLPKEGGRFDLPIALGILAATNQIPKESLDKYEFVGELALTGELRGIRGVLPLVLSALADHRTLILPTPNSAEAALADQQRVLHAKHLLDVCAYLLGKDTLSHCNMLLNIESMNHTHDMQDIKGQGSAKRALEVAAAGKHSLLMLGPPGTGKTLLASCIPTILPQLSQLAALDVAAIYSLTPAGFNPCQWQIPPFRSPHHTTSGVALVGGGRPPKPGEISLAHHGVLFLDELPEFSRQVLECLREPLEGAKVTISRAAYQVTFPANFQLVAAMNPCPCGYAGSVDQCCTCSYEQINRYLNKISGPLLDRMDMHIEVLPITAELLMDNTMAEASHVIRERVLKAQRLQYARQGKLNGMMALSDLEQHCGLEKNAKNLLQTSANKLNLSARGFHRILKLARTIADLAEQPSIQEEQIAEALAFRCLDRSAHRNG